MCCTRRGRMHKVLLSMGVSLFTSACLYSLPFLALCLPCVPSLPDSACPTTGRTGNFKQFNCPDGYSMTLPASSTPPMMMQFATFSPPVVQTEFHPITLLIFFALYFILGLNTFGIATPSGLFLPIILMGSADGRLLGLFVGSCSNIDQGLYAVLGAASLMAGSMIMTVSLCVIFLDLTNNLLLLPITMLVLLISKTVGDAFNPSIYEIVLHLKGLPFLEAHAEPWMRNLTVGELAAAKTLVVTLHGIEKVSRVVEVLRNTTHNGFPVVDYGVISSSGEQENASELHGLVLRMHLIALLRKKWFLPEKRRTEEWEVRERFTSVDLAERGQKVDEVVLTEEEMQMYVDLHLFTSTTPYTVVENMSVAKAMVLFRQVGLRHLLIVPKYQGAGVSPVVGILTRQDLMAKNILGAFPHLAKSKGREKSTVGHA